MYYNSTVHKKTKSAFLNKKRVADPKKYIRNKNLFGQPPKENIHYICIHIWQ